MNSSCKKFGSESSKRWSNDTPRHRASEIAFSLKNSHFSEFSMNNEQKKDPLRKFVGKILGKVFRNDKMQESGRTELVSPVPTQQGKVFAPPPPPPPVPSKASPSQIVGIQSVQSALLDPPLPPTILNRVIVEPKKTLHVVGDVSVPQQQGVQQALQPDIVDKPLGESKSEQTTFSSKIEQLQVATNGQAATQQAFEESLFPSQFSTPEPAKIILATDQGVQEFATALSRPLGNTNVQDVPGLNGPAKDMTLAPGFPADISPIKATDIRPF
jgi:hypothetical protein